MKICLIELMPFPYVIGGGTTHLMNLGKSLAELGHEVHILSSKPSKNYEKISHCPKNIILHNVGIKHKKFEGGIIQYFYRFLFELTFVLASLRKLKQINPEIIDCQSPITTALPASLSKKNFTITCHGIHSQGFEKLYLSKKQKFAAVSLNSLYKIIAKYNVKKAKRLISQGEETLNYYLALAGDKSKGVLVNNMVDTDFWQTSHKKEKKLIVTAARFTKQKSLDRLIRALNKLKDYRLFLIGNGELEKELKNLAKKNTCFLGYLNPQQTLNFYKKARFTILPSEFEGLPYSILEAMSCKVIPITTNVGDLSTLIKDKKNGFLLKDNKPETIINTLDKIENINLEKIGENARKTILERYSSKKVAKKFVRVYSSIS